MQPILNLLNPQGSSGYYTDKWLTVLDNNLKYLRDHQTTNRKEVSLDVQNRFMGDPITMFNALRIPPQLHSSVMRCMGWQKPEDYKEYFTFLYIPSMETTDRLRSLSNITA